MIPRLFLDYLDKTWEHIFIRIIATSRAIFGEVIDQIDLVEKNRE